MHHKKIQSSKFKTRKRGFTLLELIIYMGLLMILLAIISQLFASTVETQLSSQSYSYTQQDGRYILNRLTYDIQQASSVTTPVNIGDQTGTLTLVINGVSYTYSVTNGNLLVNGVQLNGFNTSVSNTLFQKIGNTGGKPTIKLSYTVTGKILRQTGSFETKSFATTVGLR